MKIIFVHCGEEMRYKRSHSYEHNWTISWKETWKKIQVRTGFEPITSAISVQRSTNWANKRAASWSLCWTYMKIIYVAHTWLSYISSYYSPLGRFIWIQHCDQLPVSLLAQLVERCNGIAEVRGHALSKIGWFNRSTTTIWIHHLATSIATYIEDAYTRKNQVEINMIWPTQF